MSCVFWGKRKRAVYNPSSSPFSPSTRFFFSRLAVTHRSRCSVTSSPVPNASPHSLPLGFQWIKQNTVSHYQADSSLSLTASPPPLPPPSLPPSCVESSPASVNPGLSCPAVCIPLLLGEHGMAPGPLRSHGREVNGRERESGRGGGGGGGG